jgi:hypothetical protein
MSHKTMSDRPGRGRGSEATNRRTATFLAAGLATVLVLGGCTKEAGRTELSGQRPGTIPQPRVPEGFPAAPANERVDLAVPVFSNPTGVTNPLFPISSQGSVLMLGRVEGKDFRTEVTLLPETRFIEWEGAVVETLVSQYVAYLDGRLHEVAYDLYAQADDGSVWYFGEDVFNFRDGAIVDTHGTWIAGRDGPAAMIMPGDPKVGDVYRPENIPGFVFEEVTVQDVDRTLDGPLGTVEGGLVIQELHMDGAKEDKTFGPGYGEFFTGGGGDVEAIALAVPTDALSEPVPADLSTMRAGAMRAFDAARDGRWDAASATVAEVTAAWNAYASTTMPPAIESRVNAALGRLDDDVRAHDGATAGQAALDVALSSLDLQLRHRPPAEIDLARFDLWLARMTLDATAGNAAAVNGDFFALDYIRDRILHALGSADVTEINLALEELGAPVADGALDAVAEGARQLRVALAGMQVAS